MKEACLILLQTIPANIDMENFETNLKLKFPQIDSYHDLHIWQLSSQKYIATVHIIFKDSKLYNKIIDDVRQYFHDHNIANVTIQPEFCDQTSSSVECLVQCTKPECLDKVCCKDSITDLREVSVCSDTNGHDHGHGHGHGHSHSHSKKSKKHKEHHHGHTHAHKHTHGLKHSHDKHSHNHGHSKVHAKEAAEVPKEVVNTKMSQEDDMQEISLDNVEFSSNIPATENNEINTVVEECKTDVETSKIPEKTEISVIEQNKDSKNITSSEDENLKEKDPAVDKNLKC